MDPNPAAVSKVTPFVLSARKATGQRIVCLTAYDFPTARLADESGIDLILVGDSLAQVVLGYDSTLPVTADEMLHHLKAARRGTRRALLMADLPYGSYHGSSDLAVATAIRFLKEGGAEAVKLEGGRKRTALIRSMTDAEIPVAGHIGLTPQSVRVMGGYRVQGNSVDTARELMEDALALEDAGVFALVLEGMPREVASAITRRLRIPTIGIGAGPDCDGQIMVIHDLLNLTFQPPAKFVRAYANLAETLRDAISRFRQDVIESRYPNDQESYHLPVTELSAFSGR
ncbi:MAG TPA: 3-methyl-2-oxobutanoate hydroxymethyltransferase [Terriglobia bacterium]|nr:3-methyl-2-oxobutanoate hydroxymethyltransferase [Terriglobia bacterium]